MDQGPVSVSLPLWYDRCELKNGSCILSGSVSAGSEILSMGKWTKCYDCPISLKCKKPIGCGTTTRKRWFLTDFLPPLGHMYADAWKWPFYHHGHNSLLGHDKLHPMRNGWQLWRYFNNNGILSKNISKAMHRGHRSIESSGEMYQQPLFCIFCCSLYVLPLRSSFHKWTKKWVQIEPSSTDLCDEILL